MFNTNDLSGSIDVHTAYFEWKKRRRKTQELLSQEPSIRTTGIIKNVPKQKMFGNLLIVTSCVLLILFSSPILALELRHIVNIVTSPFVPNAQEFTGEKRGFAALLPKPTIPPKEEQFHIYIPTIEVSSDIIANVDANNTKEYESALKKGIAHAKGTAFPGEDGDQTKTIFLFSHSTNAPFNISTYNALFYNLKDVKVNDDIYIVFWGDRYTYKVTDKKIVDPFDTSFLTPQLDKEQLILQTCWPPGTSSKRLLIFAERT